MNNKRKWLGVAVGLCLSPLGLVAQPSEQGAADTTVKASLEEVYVTARRREESLQETPVAVSAMGADALAEAGGILNNRSAAIGSRFAVW